MELAQVKNIGVKTLERLNGDNIYTKEDLLLCFPKQYNFYEVDNENAFSGKLLCFRATIITKPVLIKVRSHSKAFIFYCLVNNLKVKCVIFSGDFLRFQLQPNKPIIAYGKYKAKENEFSLTSIFFMDFDYRITVDYGFKDIKNSLIANAVKTILEQGYTIKDDLPLKYVSKYRLLSRQDLIYKAHFPASKEDYRQVKRRIRYEEFFWYAAALEGLRQLRGFEQKNPRVINYELLELKIAGLRYELTNDQKQALMAILADMSKNKVMNRLVEGDVGSGKTIVAFLAAIAAIEAGYQVALMAPTELLANQHHANFKELFPMYSCELLTSSIKQSSKEEILYKLLHHRIKFIIGTHALIQSKVLFNKLGLVIIDEQHRFGVNQRKALIDKFKQVDCLYLTATPIPRTLGLASFGDLDLSLIVEKPANRKPVITKIIPQDCLDLLQPILKRHLARGEQIYVVAPVIGQSQDLIDIEQAYELFKSFLPDAKIAKVHGRLKADLKAQIMSDFKNRQLNCLIATTVIEVGVDVKQATVMVILNAERYGLSQIHQLRGRVGRSDLQSYCYLVSPKDNVCRLEILERTSDGFVLAEEDFKLRGPGDYLGEEQSGYGSLSFDFESDDLKIWQCALADSKEFLADYLNGLITSAKLDTILAKIQNKKTKIN